MPGGVEQKVSREHLNVVLIYIHDNRYTIGDFRVTISYKLRS
jgi:hypothetical protein